MPMVELSELQTQLAALFWPFVRIGACLMVAPIFGARYVPRRIRIVLSGVLALLVAPLLPQNPAAVLSSAGVVTTAQQVLIGAVMGFCLQLVFDAMALGGQLLANGMGLGFAFNVDPLRGVSTPALGQLFILVGSLLFLSLNGHLAIVQMLADSFRWLPVGAQGIDGAGLEQLSNWGTSLFAGALRIALPGMTALVIVNLAFGIVSRAAPALNLFAVGLPVTLVVGLVIVLFSFTGMQSSFVAMIEESFAFLRGILSGGA
jgi:flagellar biosynthetic protein FliR